ncbi:MAG: ABC transporter permease [Thermoguttaceae bacterium]
MVLDLTDVTPFFTWLLGPGWTDGALFQPITLVVLLLLAGFGLFTLVRRARSGCGETSRRAGLVFATIMATVAVVVLGLSLGWMCLSAKTAAALQPKLLNSVAWGLGAGWYQGAAYQWTLVVLCASAIALLLGWLVAAVRRGPGAALAGTGQVAGDAILDTLRISPRRVGALAWLAVMESIRRRVLVVFAVFIVILLFAGWFLDRENIDPARVYLDFVLTATTYLVLLLSLFLSSLSLPTDLKNRTLHTIVTKPVRASEVVLGRIVGFAAVTTLLLAPMTAISYVFVHRGLAHTHELVVDDLQPVEGSRPGQPTALQGKTSRVHAHRHRVFVGPDGKPTNTEMEQRHTHLVTPHKDGEKTVYTVGPAQGMLVARVPVYGKLTFRDRSGKPAEKGINVGDEWTYRSFIEGGSLGAAIWTFDGVTRERFPKGLPAEMTLEAFRTYKGVIEKPVLGSLWVRNPSSDKNKPVQVMLFDSKDFVIDVHRIPLQWQTAKGEKIDLFKDIVSSDGRVEIWLKCEDRGQYFGAAQADMYLKARNASFAWNFLKGYLSIWLAGLLVVSLGVMFSTFLSGPIAMLATLGALVAGFFHDFMYRLATGQTLGGGPFESITRILTSANMTSQAEPGLTTTVEQTLDAVAKFGLYLLSAVLPDFSRFNFAEFVASGFSIPGDTAAMYACRTFAFVVPVFVVAYLCLKNREVAQ